MEAVFERLNQNARVVLCGLIGEYGADGTASGPKNFSNLLMRRVRLQGFNLLDHAARYPEAVARLGLWILLGRIKARHTLVEGLDAAPEALAGMFRGENTGKLIVKIV